MLILRYENAWSVIDIAIPFRPSCVFWLVFCFYLCDVIVFLLVLVLVSVGVCMCIGVYTYLCGVYSCICVCTCICEFV